MSLLPYLMWTLAGTGGASQARKGVFLQVHADRIQAVMAELAGASA